MRCIVIEDEIPAQRIVQHYISKLPELKIIGVFQSALKANGILQNGGVDLVFLDINLPDISGIQYIKTLSRPPTIIMTTAYPEHAAESFELDAICDYLVKPFSFERFLKAVNKAKKNQEPYKEEKVDAEEPGVFFINIDKTLQKIVLSDILFIESDKNYVTLTTTSGKYTYIDSLKNWVEKLPAAEFLQVHKSFLVHLGHVHKMTGNLVFVQDNKIPVGRKYRTALLKRLKQE